MPPRPHTILYVDDEPSNLATFKYCFGERFEVLVAQSGDEALKILAAQPVAVMMADQRMPGMTGAQLCQAARERFPDVVRMIVTAYADVTAAVEAINSGQVLRYVFKPWREEQMADVLRIGVEAYELGVLLRDLQTRMLQHEQQATINYVLRTVLHELKAPAKAAHMNLHWMADTLRGLAQGAQAAPMQQQAAFTGMLAAAQEALDSIKLIVQRIDGFRRGEPAGRPTGATADLTRAVQAAVSIVGPELRRRAEVDLQLTEVPLVAAEAAQLNQILVNLLSNAVEALPLGQAEHNLVTVRTSVRDGQAFVEIEDTGPGIPAELLPRIFDPFVSTKSDDPARGFGLAVVRDVVHELGGEITARSEVGTGSCFTVTLRLA